jgi:hypothetical protein
MCTDVGSWNDDAVSRAEIYLAVIACKEPLQRENATTARLANFIGLTASHELGHLLGLEHFHGADDAITRGCDDDDTCPNLTKDLFVEWHIMAFTRDWPSAISNIEGATRDFFFNAHSERRLLYSALQASNHWSNLGNLNAGEGRADLLYGSVRSPATVEWHAHRSTGSAFDADSTWRTDAGDAGNIFLVGDVNGDKRADLVYGQNLSSTHVTVAPDLTKIRWYGRRSLGGSFGHVSTWRTDAGDEGDLFR